MNENPYEAIWVVVNHGYTDLVMTAARTAGAKGGTVISARGTGNKDMEQFFGVTITPEKDIVIILVPAEIRDRVMMAVNEGAGMSTKGQGIAFSLPTSDTVGLVPSEMPPSKTGDSNK